MVTMAVDAVLVSQGPLVQIIFTVALKSFLLKFHFASQVCFVWSLVSLQLLCQCLTSSILLTLFSELRCSLLVIYKIYLGIWFRRECLNRTQRAYSLQRRISAQLKYLPDDRIGRLWSYDIKQCSITTKFESLCKLFSCAWWVLFERCQTLSFALRYTQVYVIVISRCSTPQKVVWFTKIS